MRGSVDGDAGLFLVNTGNRGSLTLAQTFADDHKLRERYGSKLEAVYGATGVPVVTVTWAPQGACSWRWATRASRAASGSSPGAIRMRPFEP